MLCTQRMLVPTTECKESFKIKKENFTAQFKTKPTSTQSLMNGFS